MGDVREELATEMDLLVKGLKIVTRCVTVDELVAAFWKFCTPTTCFIPTKDSRRIGIETLFSLRLADGTVVVRGLCVVRDVWTTDENPFGRAGIQVSVIRISDDTKDVYTRILALRAAKTETARIESRADMATIEMPPALPPPPNDCAIAEDSEHTERARTELDPPGIVALEKPSELARGSITTLLGMPPPDLAAPRYVAEEPRAVKIASPVRPAWWRRIAHAVIDLVTGASRRFRARS
jgi:Tfp pilus assembly protein PilZ